MSGTPKLNNDASGVVINLSSALAQSQSLLRLLDEQSRQIDLLKQKNEKLQHEVMSLQATSEQHSIDADVPTQIDQLFRRDVEKQFKIDRLKRTIRVLRAKDKQCKAHHPQVGLSNTSPNKFDSSLPSPVSERIRDQDKRIKSELGQDISVVTNTALGKRSADENRAHIQTPRRTGPLQEVDANRCKPIIGESPSKRPRFTKINSESLGIFAEDGEDYARLGRGNLEQKNVPVLRDTDLSTRLDALLKTSNWNSSTFVKHGETSQRSFNSFQIQPNPVSVDKSSIASSRKTKSHSKTNAGNQSITVTPKVVAPSERERSRFLPPKSRAKHTPEDEEPFRSRPLSRLNLSHFKLNPKTNNGYAYAYNEVVRGQHARKCLPGCTRSCCRDTFRAIALSLGINSGSSEDDILVEFLGQGSEEKIQSLTAVARQNLLHEALAQRFANDFGKTHRTTHVRALSPVDFWNADMPGTQEQTEKQDQIGLREREEVEIRYRDACKDNGKWMFADE